MQHVDLMVIDQPLCALDTFDLRIEQRLGVATKGVRRVTRQVKHRLRVVACQRGVNLGIHRCDAADFVGRGIPDELKILPPRALGSIEQPGSPLKPGDGFRWPQRIE